MIYVAYVLISEKHKINNLNNKYRDRCDIHYPHGFSVEPGGFGKLRLGFMCFHYANLQWKI